MTPFEAIQANPDATDEQILAVVNSPVVSRTPFMLTFNQIDLISAELTGDTLVAKAFTDALASLKQSDSWWQAKWDTLAANGVDVSLDVTQGKLAAFAAAYPALADAITYIASKGVTTTQASYTANHVRAARLRIEYEAWHRSRYATVLSFETNPPETIPTLAEVIA